MRIISHRGNLDGPGSARDNHPDDIQKALNEGFDVEIDLWWHDDQWMLGHDEPLHPVSRHWLVFRADALWIHCKNAEACHKIQHMFPDDNANYFWHQSDDRVLTYMGYWWTFPGKELVCDAVAVMPEKDEGWAISEACAVCTDYPRRYKEWSQNQS